MTATIVQERGTRPACIVNSLPKSGTNLLSKVIGSLPGMSSGNFHLEAAASAPDSDRPDSHGVIRYPDEMIPIGVGRPRLMSRQAIHGSLSRLTEGIYITAHVPYSSGMASLLKELDILMVTVIRDPRDVAVSQARYVANSPGNPLHSYYQSLSESDRVMAAIVGINGPRPIPILRSLRERLESVVSWKSEAFNLLTRFERLVGPRGGGSPELQHQEIRAIASHLGFHCAARDIDAVASHAFGNTATFLTGRIGGWHDRFREEHKSACKELIGQLLIDLGYERDMDW